MVKPCYHLIDYKHFLSEIRPWNVQKLWKCFVLSFKLDASQYTMFYSEMTKIFIVSESCFHWISKPLVLLIVLDLNFDRSVIIEPAIAIGSINSPLLGWTNGTVQRIFPKFGIMLWTVRVKSSEILKLP